MQGVPENTSPSEPSEDPAQRALAYYNQAMEAIDILYEAAAAGHDGALEVLGALTDKLTTRGGDWSQMKYLKD
jgi:hypothetical protein